MADLEEDAPPTNVLVNIVHQVNDLSTLFSLLTVSHQVYEITSRRLYRNPFHSAALATIHPHRVHGRLFEFFVDHSESLHSQDVQDDHDLLGQLRDFRRRTKHPTTMQQRSPPTRIDYLALVQSMDGLVDFVASPKLALSMHWVEQATGLPWNATAPGSIINAVTSSLAWTLGQHQQWCRLTDVVVPLYDLDRFMSAIDNMQAVQHITFDMGQPEEEGPPPPPIRRVCRLNRIQGALHYMRQWETRGRRRLARGSDASRLRTADVVRLASEEWANAEMLKLVRVLYDMTMVASVDRFRALDLKNWATFLRLAATDADFEAVQSIDFLSGGEAEEEGEGRERGDSGTSNSSCPLAAVLPPPMPPIIPPVIPGSIWRRFRSLRSLALLCSRPDTFRLARPLPPPQDNINHSINSNSNTDLPTARKSPRIPLQHLRVEYETPEHLPTLLEDALAAFGETLCTVRFECRPSLATLAASKTASERDIDDPSFRHGPEIQLGGGGGGGWHCPNLTSLHISARGMIHWEDIMGSILLECPCLEVLEVVDDTPKYSLLSSSSSTTTSTNISSSTRAWSLPSLRRLVLKGYPAVTFSPRSLSSMGAQLTSLELYGAGWLGDERRFFIPPASDMRRAKMEAWRRPRQKLLQEKKNNDTRWWWHLPNLQSLKLVGECALWFPVETVLAQGVCPRLKTLTLDIGGHRFPSLIGGGAHQQEKEQDMEEQEEEEEKEDRDTEEIGHCHNRQKDAQDTSATTLAAAPPSCLTSLSLIGAWEVTDATLNRLLHVPDSGSDGGSGGGGGLCPKLEALVLHQARHYTNAGLVTIAEQHPTLERVVTSRYLRGRDAKRAGLELLPWSGGRSKGAGADGHDHATEYQGPPPTVADLAQTTGQKDLRCIIYQMDTLYYRRATTTW